MKLIDVEKVSYEVSATDFKLLFVEGLELTIHEMKFLLQKTVRVMQNDALFIFRQMRFQYFIEEIVIERTRLFTAQHSHFKYR